MTWRLRPFGCSQNLRSCFLIVRLLVGVLGSKWGRCVWRGEMAKDFKEATAKYGPILAQEMARVREPYRSAIEAARWLNSERIYKLPRGLSDAELIAAVGERVKKSSKKWGRRSNAWRDDLVSSGPASAVRHIVKNGKPAQ